MDQKSLKELLTTRTKIGLAFIYLAGIGWIAELVIPFTSLEPKIPILVGVLATAEISFLVGIAILGKPVYEAIKARIKASVQRRPSPPQTPPQE